MKTIEKYDKQIEFIFQQHGFPNFPGEEKKDLTNKEKSATIGVKKMEEKGTYMTVFFHYRDRFGVPRLTTCLILHPNGLVSAKGVAVCSLEENPDKHRGRLIAESKARYALEAGVSKPFLNPKAYQSIMTTDYDFSNNRRTFKYVDSPSWTTLTKREKHFVERITQKWSSNALVNTNSKTQNMEEVYVGQTP
jgi:hypothetical protein